MTFNIRKPKLEQVDPPRSPRETLPTMYDLPSEFPEEPGLPDEFHDLQPQLLSRTLRLSHYTSDNYFTASDLNVYYDLHHPLWHKRPDWFLAVDVPRLYEGNDLRRSYVAWQERHSPYVVVEFLSPGTDAEDLGRFQSRTSSKTDAHSTDANGAESPPGKLTVYEHYLRVPHYLVYSRYTQQLRYFRLTGGRYEEQALNSETPLVWLTDLDVGLGIWSGEFEGIEAHWLRWCDHDGTFLLTDTEQAQAQLTKTQAQLVQAARNLLATGMELAQVIELLNLSEAQVAALEAEAE